jgi:tetrapyrrole methylase family protein/MazG family protein
VTAVGRVVVVGLGPGDPGLVTAATLAAIEATSVRFLRTERHPSASLVARATTFDHHYDGADTFDDVYRRIVEDLCAAAAEHGEVLYAVPGSPRVLERTVDWLVEAADAGRVEVEVLAAMSFVDLAWVRLGIDPFEDGVRLIDAHRFATAAAGERGPLLVAHCHNQRVLSDVKLAVEDPPTEPVVVLQRLGLPDESVTTVDWADLDRDVEADHLTSIFVPRLGAPVAGEVAAFVDLVATLRAECPWDAEQTHATLARHLVEETYEVLDALDGVGDGGPDTDADAYADLEEELGDLLFQIVFHTTLATEAGAFGLAEVTRGIHDKLVHRHPHVFPRAGVLGDVEVAGADDVAANWETIKQDEKGRASIFDGIPRHLPALAYAAKVHKKATALGLDVDALHPPAAIESAADGAVVDEDAIGDLLLAAVGLARRHDLDPEAALRRAADGLRARAQTLES